MVSMNHRVGTKPYPSWHIGLTHDLEEQKMYWGREQKENVSSWTSWTGDSLADAQDIEAHYVKKGMKGLTGEDLSPSKTVYIYIF